MAAQYPTLDIGSISGITDNNDDCADKVFNICSNYSNSYICDDEIHSFFQSDSGDAIKLLHINCRSIDKNFTAVESLLFASHPITILAVSEIWLTTATQDIHQIPGYVFISSPRVTKSCGGVGIYLSELFDYVKRTDISDMSPFLECLFIEVKQSNKHSILIGCVYRPPNSDVVLFNKRMLEIINIINAGSVKVTFMLGDFNLDLLKYQDHPHIGEFLGNMLSHSFFPTIRNPTRITETSATLLDNIFTNCIRNNFSAAVIYSDISDHLPVAVRIETGVPKNKLHNFYTSRSFDSVSLCNFKVQLLNYPWNDVDYSFSACTDPSEAFNLFYNVYKDIFNKCFPKITTRRSYRMTPRHEWMTKGLIVSCNKKSKMYKKYRQHPTQANKDKYIVYRNKLKSLLKKAERTFFAEKFKSYTGDMRKTWNLIGLTLNKTKLKLLTSTFLIDGVETNNKSVVADRFNKFFVGVGKNLASSIPESSAHFSTYLKSPILESMTLFLTDADEVIDIVSKFTNKKGVGYDDIPIFILKSTIVYVAETISKIINYSFQAGIFPSSLKIAKVCPIFKDGEKNLFTNYRPISVLSCFSKIFEKALYNRLLSFLEKKNILIDQQFGFREHYSTYMAVMNMYDGLSTAIDNKEFAVGVFIDLSKAFDSLDHDILLQKLSHYGIRGVVLNLFRSYLQNRYQYVAYNDSNSPLERIVCGVPQGSVLGPVLFLIYINDIVNSSHIMKFILFADDTNAYHSDSDWSRLVLTLNSELDKLSVWLRSNKLSLNIKKCNYILFGHKKVPLCDSELHILINGQKLERVEHTKFLGVIVDSKLTFSNHIQYISLKILKGLGIMCKLRNILPSSVLLTLYYTLIYPYLTYCTIIWGCANMTALHKLVILQKRAIRIITRSPYRTASNPLFLRLRLLKVYDIYNLQLAIFMYKYLCFLLPKSCGMYFTLNSAPSYITRSNNDFVVPTFRTTIRERSISVAGPRFWDALPRSARNCTCFNTLKREIRSFLFLSYT